MKQLAFSMSFLMLITACGPAPEQIAQTMVAQTATVEQSIAEGIATGVAATEIANPTLTSAPSLIPTAMPSPTETPPSRPLVLEGRWEGPVNQPGARYYTTILTLAGCSENNTKCGSVEYPELSCGGEISFLYEENGIYYLHENITYGSICTIEEDLELQHISGDKWKITYHYGSGTTQAIVTKTK